MTSIVSPVAGELRNTFEEWFIHGLTVPNEISGYSPKVFYRESPKGTPPQYLCDLVGHCLAGKSASTRGSFASGIYQSLQD